MCILIKPINRIDLFIDFIAAQTEDLISKCNGAHFDYVFTHAAPRSIFEQHKVELCTLQLDEDTIDHTSEDNLQKIMNVITFDNWRFGHYHQDLDLDEKFSILYVCLFCFNI